MLAENIIIFHSGVRRTQAEGVHEEADRSA